MTNSKNQINKDHPRIKNRTLEEQKHRDDLAKTLFLIHENKIKGGDIVGVCEKFLNDSQVTNESKKLLIDKLLVSSQGYLFIDNYVQLLSNFRKKPSLLNDFEFVDKLVQNGYKNDIIKYIDNAPRKKLNTLNNCVFSPNKLNEFDDTIKNILFQPYGDWGIRDWYSNLRNIFYSYSQLNNGECLINDFNISENTIDYLVKILEIQDYPSQSDADGIFLKLFDDDAEYEKFWYYFNDIVGIGSKTVNIKDIEEYSSKIKESPYYDYIFLHCYNLESSGLFMSFNILKNMKDTRLKDLLFKNLFHNNYGHIDKLLLTEDFEYLLSLPNYKELLDFDFATASGVPENRQFNIQKDVIIDGEQVSVVVNCFMKYGNLDRTSGKYIVGKKDGKKVFIFDDSLCQHKFIADKYGLDNVLGGGWLDLGANSGNERGGFKVANHYSASKMYGLDPYEESGFTQKVFDSLLDR